MFSFISFRTLTLAMVLASSPLMISATPPSTSNTSLRTNAGAAVATGVQQSTKLGELQGQVQLLNRRGTRPARSVASEDVVVFFVPDKPLPAAARSHNAAAKFEMATVGKAYAPRVLAVPKGTEVHFPNRDRILHNVFSVSGKNRFDLDLYGAGESRSHTFDESGLVRVFCNVHRGHDRLSLGARYAVLNSASE